ncbi:MAG: hypothetical protein ACKO5J_06055 [Rubrivivax sp.]
MEVWLDVTAGARIRLEVQGNAATLERRCTRERFLGQWGTSPLVGARYFGVYGDEGVPGVAASLSVRAADGGTLVLELRGIDERLLLPPVTVQRVAGALPPPLCP